MTALERALYRLIRILLAYCVVIVLRFVIDNATDFLIPQWAVPILMAVLNAIAKFLREKWYIDIKL